MVNMIQNLITDSFFDGVHIHNQCTVIEVENGRILNVKTSEPGSVNELLKHGNTFDFRGKFLSPGLIDSHNHFTLTSLKMAYQVNFGSSVSFSELKEILRKNMGNIIHGWIQGYGLNEYIMNERKLPDRHVVDSVINDIPVFITHVTEHYALCNSRALDIAGITSGTDDPPNGRLGRDLNGNPNGILYEAGAMDLVKKFIPEYNVDDYEDAIIYGSEMYMKSGLTAVKDTGGTGADINEETRIMAFNNLSIGKRIDLRLMIALPVYSIEDVDNRISMSRKIKENALLKFAGFKVFLDGSIMSRTAWMKNPYKKMKESDKTGNGMPLWNTDSFREAIHRLAKTGNHISIHVIGDRAIEEALNTIEYVQSEGVKSSFALVHAYKLNDGLIKRIEKLSTDIETQTAFIYFIGDALQQNLEDSESRCMFPVKTLMEKGINISDGSDSPVTPYSPVYGIFSSIYRIVKSGRKESVFSNNENITPEDALKIYTSMSSAVTGWNDIGSIKPGSCADFSIWSINPQKLDADIGKWLNIKLDAPIFR